MTASSSSSATEVEQPSAIEGKSFPEHPSEPAISFTPEDTPTTSDPNVLYGFNTLNDVQRYAVGALSAVFLGKRKDINAAAFARDYMMRLFNALGLSPGQIEALLSLEPEPNVTHDVVNQCVQLVGDEASRFQAIQAMLALAVVGGVYDSRARAFLVDVAEVFNVPWVKVAAVELAIAVELVRRMKDGKEAVEEKRESTAAQYLNARRRRKKKRYAAAKAGGITLVGGVLFGLTGGIIAPALLTSLAGIGIAGAAGLAATGPATSGAVVVSLFGVAGAGLTGRKARKRMGMKVSEFRFEREDDPRILYQRQFTGYKDPAWLIQQKGTAEDIQPHIPNGAAADESASHGVTINGYEDDNLSQRQRAAAEVGLAYSESLPTISANTDKKPDATSDIRTSFASSNDSLPSDSGLDPITMSSKEFDDQRSSNGLTKAPLSDPSLHLVITVPAWLESRRAGSAFAQFTCVRSELPFSQHVSLRWEARRLHEMSKAFAKFWASKATVTTIQQTYPYMVTAASSVAGAVAVAIALPLTVISCLDYIDNPWSVLVSRSNGAGEQLADELTLRAYGNRPVTLIGYSLGARVIFKALESLAARKATGIVSDVFLIGAPVTADPEKWKKVSKVIAGRLVNGYCPFDWALAYFHRGCGHGIYVAGLRQVACPSVINMNLAFIGVGGHRWLKNAMERAVKAMGVASGKIEMPPAPLIFRGGKKESVLEDGDDLAAETKFDDFDDSIGVKHDADSTGSADNGSIVEDDSMDESSANGELEVHRRASDAGTSTGHGVNKKKSSGKFWPWNSWNFSKRGSGKRKNIPAVNGRKEAASMARKDGSNVTDEPPSDGIPESDPVPVLEGQLLDLEPEGVDSVPANKADGFDWELQRRLWAEQERRIADDPTGQAALNLTVDDLIPSAAVLNIGVEITGRRLRTFTEQDDPFPTSHTEVFTNCMDEQKALVVNVYEYMPKTKSLPLSMEKFHASAEAENREYEKEESTRTEGKEDADNIATASVSVYPKLLEELRLEWSEMQPKGSMRFGVTISISEDGDLAVEVEEQTDENCVGRTVKACVGHEKLCSMRERKILEERERRKLESRRKKKHDVKAITSGKQEVLALPGPESLAHSPSAQPNSTTETEFNETKALKNDVISEHEDTFVRRERIKDIAS